MLLDRVAHVHGTYRLAASGQILDLHRLPRNVARVGARHAEVTFTRSLIEDLARRNLTINALALPFPLPTWAVGKALINAHGGLDNLAVHRLRLIGELTERLQEDPLRLLLIARFACMGPNWTVDPATLDAMASQAGQLSTESVERCLAELPRPRTAGAGPLF